MNSIYLNGRQTEPQENMLPLSAMYEDADGGREFDLRTLHLKDGVIFIKGEINSAMAVRFASAMLHLSREGKKVRIYLNSPGGEVNSGLMMYDIIQSFDGEVEIYCVGMAASMAAVLLAGGQKGRRFILPHSQVMIHEPLISGGFGGSASTIEKTAKTILDVRDLTNGLIAKHTSHTLEEVNKATEHDNYMTAEQAVEFGICDEVRGFF
jgi:ATP-dependent Clp protease protease subunit